jgi:hypothetical protein
VASKRHSTGFWRLNFCQTYQHPMSFGDDIRNGVPIGLPSILSLGLPPLVNPYPALDLDFINNPLDPRITFTRATTATYFNSSGVLSTAASGEARFDYNPTTLAARGLLIEEQRTNSFPNSNDFSNATYWTVFGTAVVTAGAGTGPDNLTSASNLAGATNTTLSGNNLEESLSISASTAYTFSVFVKSNGGTEVVLRLRDSTGGSESSSVLAVTSAWQRISLTRTMAVGATSVRCIIGQTNGNILIYGAQLEAGAFATSYIPTTTIALTRNADVASMTGTNFSDWYNAVEGSLFGEFSVYTSVGSKAIVGITDGTNNNRVQFFAASNDPFVLSPRLVAGGVATNPANTGSIAVNSVGKAIIAYAVGTNAGGFSVNGSSIAQSSPASAFSNVNSLEIGKATGLTQLNGYIRRIAYYPTRLADTTLQALTA